MLSNQWDFYNTKLKINKICIYGEHDINKRTKELDLIGLGKEYYNQIAGDYTKDLVVT